MGLDLKIVNEVIKKSKDISSGYKKTQADYIDSNNSINGFFKEELINKNAFSDFCIFNY